MARQTGLAPGGSNVRYGIAALSTTEAVALARAAAKAGANGLMVLPPYVYSSDWREMKAHVSAVMSATSLSCMLYNNPVAYKTDFLPAQIAELAAEHDADDGGGQERHRKCGQERKARARHQHHARVAADHRERAMREVNHAADAEDQRQAERDQKVITPEHEAIHHLFQQERELHLGYPGAFSSEVDSGSRKENASKQESRAPFRFNRNGKGSRQMRPSRQVQPKRS